MPRRKSLIKAVPIKMTGVDLSVPSPGMALQAPLLSQKKITRKGLASYVEKVLALYAPETIPALMEQLKHGAVKGDRDLIDKGLKVFGLLGASGGITINNMNNNNNNATASAVASVKGFDAVMRNLAQQDRAIEAEYESAE